tara:strand:+ start:187 stop:2517 length:2331 start_codon:yes stop_codon:yes gene_type:complete
MMKKYLITILFICPAIIFAAVPSGSQYNTDNREFMVEDALNDASDTPTMILCFMKNLRTDLMVNKGNYLAQIDEEACNASGQISSGPKSEDKASATSASSSAASKAYTDVISVVTRASSSDPMVAKTWLVVDGPSGPMTVYIQGSATSAKTDSNPYGVFQLDYTGVDGNGDDVMYGVLKANAAGVLEWYESMSFMGMTMINSLSLTQNLVTGTGSGAVRRTMNNSVYAYGFAYDSAGYCRVELSKDGGAPSDSDEYCFDTREAQGVKTVWDYDLYDATSGRRYDLPVKGFPVRTTVGGVTYFGFADYHGIHFDPDVIGSITDGASLQRDNGQAAATDYSVNISMGKLDKITKTFVSLASMDKYPMNSYMDIPSLSVTGSEYKFYYDHDITSFVLTHNRVCGENGCFDTPLSPEITITAQQYYDLEQGGIGSWVPGVGGVYITRNALINANNNSPGSSVEVETQEKVDPADYPPVLYCVDNCFTSSSIDAFVTKIQDGSWDSEDHAYEANNYRVNGIPASSLVTYTANGLTYETDGSAAAFPSNLSSDDNDNIDATQIPWGMRTNALLTDPSEFTCESWQDGADYCTSGLWNGSISEYYAWRTGHKRWDKNYVVKDARGDTVNFSKPMEVYYQVPTDAANGNFSGKEVMLDYGGSGNLWGFPGSCFNPSTGSFTNSCGSYGSWLPWVNRFEIPFDEDTGFVMTGRNQTGTKYLVKGRFGAVFLTPFAAKKGTLTLGTASDLPSDSTVNVGPNGTAANYIGAVPTKPDTVSVKQGEKL